MNSETNIKYSSLKRYLRDLGYGDKDARRSIKKLRAMGFTPFFLVYGAEAILPTDLEYGSPSTRAYDDQSNQTSREDSLDQL